MCLWNRRKTDRQPVFTGRLLPWKGFILKAGTSNILQPSRMNIGEQVGLVPGNRWGFRVPGSLIEVLPCQVLFPATQK